MTTQDYADAYEDDSENVRSWPAQDAQEPDVERTVDYLAHQNGVLSAENTQLTAEVERYRSESYARIAVKTRLQAERDAALAAIRRVEALADQWEHAWPDAAAQLLQAIDEAALEYPRGPVG
jgi:hypothetical protein